MPWQVIIPLKSLDDAKSRLVTMSADERLDLALAFARDALKAVLTCPSVNAVIVTTADPRVREALASAGVEFDRDPETGLNQAIEHAEAGLSAGNHAVLVGDLPALSSADLGLALLRAADHARSFVCDAAGVGTTLLAATTGHSLQPHFGAHSRAAHAATGAVEIRDALPRLRRDVDTAVDMWDAQRLGVGPATRELLHTMK